MKFIVILWFFTSNYAVPLGEYPNAMTCAFAANVLSNTWQDKVTKAFRYELACVPSLDRNHQPSPPLFAPEPNA